MTRIDTEYVEIPAITGDADWLLNPYTTKATSTIVVWILPLFMESIIATTVVNIQIAFLHRCHFVNIYFSAIVGTRLWIVT
jgi:hypothetical protein